MTEVPTRFTTANIRNSLPYLNARADYDRARRNSDILCTQEMNYRDAAKYVPATWGTSQSSHRGARARTAIHWRKERFTRAGEGVGTLSISRLFPSATRYFNWVRLYDHETGRWWTIVNVHMVPHADDDNGRVTPLPRRALVLAAIAAFVAFFHTVRGQLVVMGDFNTDLREDLKTRDPAGHVAQFLKAGLVSSAEVLGVPLRDTHGRNLYDQMFFRMRKRGAYRLVGQKVHPKRHSDHRAFSVTALVNPRGVK